MRSVNTALEQTDEDNLHKYSWLLCDACVIEPILDQDERISSKSLHSVLQLMMLILPYFLKKFMKFGEDFKRPKVSFSLSAFSNKDDSPLGGLIENFSLLAFAFLNDCESESLFFSPFWHVACQSHYAIYRKVFSSTNISAEARNFYSDEEKVIIMELNFPWLISTRKLTHAEDTRAEARNGNIFCGETSTLLLQHFFIIAAR